MAGNIPGSSVVPDVFQAGAVSVGDNTGVNARATNEGALVIQEINGKYAELVRRGYVFAARTLAQAIPNIGTFSNGLVIFNRSSSTKIVIPLYLNLSFSSLVATLGAYNEFGLAGGFIYGCGDAVAAGQPLSTMGTALGSCNMLAGAGPSPYTVILATIVCTAPYAATFPAAQIFDLGLDLAVFAGATLAASGAEWVNGQYDFQGICGLKPSTALAIGVNANTGGTGSLTFNQTIIWAEIPVGSAQLP